MTVLNFPTEESLGRPLVIGDTYTAPTNIVYIYDGVKWVAQGTTITSDVLENLVQDYVAPIFTNIISDGISFTYDPETNVLTASNSGGNATNQLTNGLYDVTLDVNGTLTLPNSTTISNDLAGEYSSSFLCMPWGVNDQTSGLFSSNSIAHPFFDPLIDTVTVGWFVSGPGLAGVKEITEIVELGDGDRAFIVDLTDGSLWADLSINIPYRFYTPDYALVYNGTRLTVNSNDWNFTQNGNLTIPGNINEKAGNDLKIAVHNNRNNDGTPGGAILSLTNNDAVDYSTYTTLDVGAYSIKLNTDYTGVFTGARHTWEFNRDGTLTFPTGGDIVFDSSDTSTISGISSIQFADSTVQTTAYTGGGAANQLVNGSYDVTLDVNGNTTFPSQTYIRQNNSYTRTVNGNNISGAPTVIWSGTHANITSVKMTIQIEGNETGDSTGWHTQTCEAVIAERYWGNLGTLDPTMSVYGVVHTSVAPLATFTVQRNATTHLIEVVATATGTTTGTLYPKVHSVELGTRD